jgi:hypothetical protein
LNVTGGGTITVQNSKFKVGSNQVSPQGTGTARVVGLSSGSYNFVFQNNEVDGAGLGGTSQASQTINVTNTGTNTWKYNYFHNIGGDLFDFNAGTRKNIIQYNAIWNIGTFTAHADTLQWFGAGEANPVISFNLSYQSIDESGPGMGQFSLFGEGTGSSLTNGKMMNNTVISTAGCAHCNWLLTAELDSSATGSNVTLKDNYIDPTGELGWTGMWFYAVGYNTAVSLFA